MTMQVRVCLECGEEYRPEAIRCADCGGELEDRTLDDDGNPIEEDGETAEAHEVQAPPPERHVVFVTPKAAELVPLADALREAGIEYHLSEQPGTAEGAPPRYALLVAVEDAAPALQAVAHLLTEEEDEAEEMHAVETRFDAARGSYVQCPACGADQPAGAVECAECGLALGAPEEGAAVCARCSAVLPSPGATCPACGASGVG